MSSTSNRPCADLGRLGGEVGQRREASEQVTGLERDRRLLGLVREVLEDGHQLGVRAPRPGPAARSRRSLAARSSTWSENGLEQGSRVLQVELSGETLDVAC